MIYLFVPLCRQEVFFSSTKSYNINSRKAKQCSGQKKRDWIRESPRNFFSFQQEFVLHKNCVAVNLFYS